ncbi:MAG: hypothetical protein ACRD3B_04730 [Candidatus Sulfotelmatobacter sp.]
MKKVIAVAVFSLLCTAFAAADTSHASLVLVKKTHPPVTKHHAHKAVKHHAPKHRHHAA